MASLKLPLENLHSAAIIVDQEEQVISANPAFNKLAGLEEKQSPNLDDLFDEENREELRSALRQMRGHHDKVMVGINLKHIGLSVRLLMTAVPVTVKNNEEAALLVFSHGEGDGSVYTDFLTKLPNRQEAAIRLRYEWNRSMRAGSIFSLALADIDHFKSVNDTLGHEAGDQILIHVANALNEEIRGSDWCARWGGEEFMILLNDSSAKEAEFVLNRVRTQLAQNPPVYNENPVPVTLSFGLVSKGTAYKSYKDMVNDADVLLYESKASGRNRVTLFETQGTPVAWSRKEIVAVVEDEVIQPLFRPIKDPENKDLGYEVSPTLPGMDPAQMRRLWQSADGLNLLKDLQVQLIRCVLKESKKTGDKSQVFVIPMSSKLATDPGFKKTAVDGGIKGADTCVLMLEGNLDLEKGAIDHLLELRELGFRIAVRDVEFNKIPLKFLTVQEVSHMFVKLDEMMRGKSDRKHPIMKDLLESIRDAGTKIIAVQEEDEHKAGKEFADIVAGYLCRRKKPEELGSVIA